MSAQHLIKELADLIRHNLQFVSFGITAVVLVLTGPFVNGVLKKVSASMHWIVRYILFVLLCTMGYGLLTSFLYSNVRKWLSGMSNITLILFTLGIYLALAWFAKQREEI